MKVESIEETRSPQGKLRLRFDNGTSMLVFPAVITELCLYPGVEIPEAAMESLRLAVDQAEALMPSGSLPYPTYDELLFSLR